MKHTVEIADSKGLTMKLSISVETFGFGGSWRTIDKGCIHLNSGKIDQDFINAREHQHLHIFLLTSAGRYAGIKLWRFISWGTVNDEGKGWLEQPVVLTLEPGGIDWVIV